MYNEILATNDVSTSVCRTRVARSHWKIVFHSNSMCKCKGKTRMASMVNTCLMSCEARFGGVQLAWHARRESMVNTGPMSCEASSRGVYGYSLRGNVPW